MTNKDTPPVARTCIYTDVERTGRCPVKGDCTGFVTEDRQIGFGEGLRCVAPRQAAVEQALARLGLDGTR
jgi:hypothetical protein